MLELARRVCLGVDVGDLLELERALHRDRPVDAAAEEQGVFLGREARRPLRHPRLDGKDLVHRRRQVPQRLQMRLLRIARKTPAQAAEDEREHEKRGELGGKCLGRGDADLRPGARQEAQARGADERALRHIADGERRAVAERLGMLKRRERVGSLA